LPPEKSQQEKVADILKGVGSDVQTVTPRATKEEKQAVAERVKVSKDQELVEVRKAQEEIAKAKEIAELDLRQKQQADAQLAEHEARQAAAEERVKQESARLDSARLDYEQNGTVKSMFGSDAARVNANLMTGIGAFASARGSGLPNLAGDNIKRDLDEWYKMELSRVAQSKELLAMSREDYEKAVANAAIELKNKEAAMAGVAAKERAAILSSHGANEAQITADTTINILRDKREALIQENQQGLRSVTTSSNRTRQDIKEGIAKAEIDSVMGTGKAALGKPEQGTLDKLGEFNDYLKQTDRTLELMKAHPELTEQVMRARRQWQREEGLRDIPWAGKPIHGLLSTVGATPKTEEEAIAGGLMFNSTADYLSGNTTKRLKGKEAEIAREIYRGVKNLEIAKGMTFGGVLRDNDVQMAQNIASTIHGNPKELIDSLQNFRDQISGRRELITKNKAVSLDEGAPGRNSPSAMREMAEAMDTLRRDPSNKEARDTVERLSKSIR
jgi:hypothetical protein